MEELFPARWADDGDPVGLVVGDPAQEVRRVLFAIDPVQAVVDEAVASGADLLVTHHPLLFRAVHSVAASTPKGRVVHDLIGNGVGLLVAHTNADSPPGGVSDSMALALGLEDLRPLEADPRDPLDKVVTFVPTDDADKLVDALAAAGAGAIGTYDRCAFLTEGQGTFRPGQGSRPAIGTVGRDRGGGGAPCRDGAAASAQGVGHRGAPYGTSLRGAGLRRLRGSGVGRRAWHWTGRPASAADEFARLRRPRRVRTSTDCCRRAGVGRPRRAR